MFIKVFLFLFLPQFILGETSKFDCGESVEKILEAKVTLLSGGHKNEGYRIGESGNNGGAYHTVIKVDGRVINAVEKRIEFPNGVWNFKGVPFVNNLIDLWTELSELAGEKGFGPKVFGYRDIFLDEELYGTKEQMKIRFLYMEEVGKDVPGKIEVFKGSHLNGKNVFELGDLNEYISGSQAEAQFQDYYIEKEGPKSKTRLAYEYLLRDEELSELKRRLAQLYHVHPDYHDGNIIVYFTLNEDGFLQGHAYGIDWNLPKMTTLEIEEKIRRIENI